MHYFSQYELFMGLVYGFEFFSMKIQGKPQQIYNEVCEYLDKQDQEQEVFVFIWKKMTKEMKTRCQEQFYFWIFWEIEKQSPFSMETIKQYLLWRAFGKKEVFGELVNNKTKTSELTKKEAQEFLSAILDFCKEHTLHIKYKSRDEQSLLESYN